MANRNSTVKIVDGKVVFSQEIIDYFENLRTVENSEWIDKYFEYLSNEENLNAKKFNKHHIIPAFLFKDDLHKNRKDTVKLADNINENLIKLSIKNHNFAHYCLWKIFPNNENARRAVYLMFGKKNINNLTNEEILEFARIQEECEKENMTDEERKEYDKLYYQLNRDEILKLQKENKDKISTRKKQHYEKNKYNILNQKKQYYKNNKKDILDKKRKYNKEHKEEKSEYNKNYYKKNIEDLSKKYKIYREEHKDDNEKYRKQICYDPIENDNCKLGTLQTRKYRHKEKYKNIIPTDCIIKSENQ